VLEDVRNALREVELSHLHSLIHSRFVLRVVRRKACNHLIYNASKRVIVNCEVMSLSLQHLRTNVLWRPTKGLIQIGQVLNLLCQPKVTQLDVPIDIYQYILRLQVSVYYVLGVKVLKSDDDLTSVEQSILLTHSSSFV
jgi:hypothetical protein